MRTSSLLKVACWSLGFIVVAATIAEAQPGRQRGRGRGRGGFGNFTRSTFGSLTTNKYLQEQLKITPKQLERMKQIDLQLQGSRAITSEAVSQKLGLSKTQVESIEKARREVFTKAFGERGRGRGNRERGNFDFEALRKKMAEASKQAEEATMKVLTSSQKSKWKSMLGAPIDRDKARTRPNFGGRGRGRGTPKKRPDV